MTWKHFKVLAYHLACTQPDKKYRQRLKQWERDCCAIAEVCRGFNSNFDREKFLTACGFEEDRNAK